MEPKQRDGHGGAEEEEHGAVESEREEVGLVGAEGLGAEWLHAEGQTREHRVASDVGEGDGEGSGGEGKVAQGPEEEHGQDGAGVDE